MNRYIIRNKTTGKYLKRTKGYRMRNTWVSSIDDATLITTGSAASQIAQRFDEHLPHQWRYTEQNAKANPAFYSVEVIKVGILLFPAGLQPFIDGLLGS